MVDPRWPFPAVQPPPPDEQRDYRWGRTAKAWDHLIPHKLKFCGLRVGNDQVRDIAVQLRADEQFEPVPLQGATGPAVPIAIWALQMTWLLFLLVPAPVYHISYETDGGNSTSSFMWRWFHIQTQPPAGQAVYPTTIVWTFVAPYLLFLLSIEWRILQYFIIPQLQVTGGFKTFGIQVGYYIWLPISFTMSLIGHLDLVTNGIFLATTWKMRDCHFGPKVDCIWTETMQESIFSKIPCGLTRHLEVIFLTDVFSFTFRYLVGMLWISMFMQALTGVRSAAPLYQVYHRYIKGKCGCCGLWARCCGSGSTCLEQLYKFFEKKKRWRTRGTTEEIRWCPEDKEFMTNSQVLSLGYPTEEAQSWWDNQMLNNTVTQSRGSHIATENYLSEVVNYEPKDYEYSNQIIRTMVGAGRGTMYQVYDDEEHISVSDHGSAVISLADSCRMYSITSMQIEYSKKKVAYYLGRNMGGPAFGITKRVLVAIRHKVVLSGIFQNGLQMNLQISLFAMVTLLEKPIRLYHTNDALGFTDAIFHINAQMFLSIGIGLLMMTRNVYEAILLFRWVMEVIHAEEGFDREDAKGFLSILKHKFWWLTIGLTCYAIILVYAFAKLFAVFYCPQSMFNLWGCANISDEARQGLCPGGKNTTGI